MISRNPLMPGSKRWEEREWVRGQGEGWWEDIFDRIASGKSPSEIAKEYGVRYAILARVIYEDEDKAREYEKALQIAADGYAHEVIGIADRSDDDVGDRKLRIDSRMKLASKWNRQRYGDTLTVNRNEARPSEDEILAKIRSLVEANPHLRGMLGRTSELVDAEIIGTESGERASSATTAGSLLPGISPTASA